MQNTDVATAESRNRNRRRRRLRNFLIQRKYQQRIALQIFVIATLALFCYLGTFFLIGRDYLNVLIASTDLTDQARASLKAELREFALFSAISVFFTGAAGAVYGFFSSHRTAGAAYAILRTMRDIRSGRNESRVHLRKHDDLKELAAEFNQLMDFLQKK